MKLGIRNLLVLVEIRDRRIQLTGLRVRLLRHLLRLTGLGTGLHGLLICRIRSGLRLVNTSLGPAIDILDVVCVLRRELIQLVQPIFYRCYLTVDPLLPGQGVHFAPEALVGLGRQAAARSRTWKNPLRHLKCLPGSS